MVVVVYSSSTLFIVLCDIERELQDQITDEGLWETITPRHFTLESLNCLSPLWIAAIGEIIIEVKSTRQLQIHLCV